MKKVSNQEKTIDGAKFSLYQEKRDGKRGADRIWREALLGFGTENDEKKNINDFVFKTKWLGNLEIKYRSMFDASLHIVFF